MSVFPTSLKRRIRWLVDFPRYGPVGLHDPQQEVRVWLHGLDETLDVTCNNVVAALRPFTIGMMLRRDQSGNLNGRTLRLCMHDRGGTERLLGVIHLRFVHSIPHSLNAAFACLRRLVSRTSASAL